MDQVTISKEEFAVMSRKLWEQRVDNGQMPEQPYVSIRIVSNGHSVEYVPESESV